MTRRERLERKAERRHEWADKASARSDASFAAVHRICDRIPLGQPILVGHHSERHARADQRRIQNGMDKGCELAALATHHESKAAGLADQLDRCVFSDDSDAIEQLEARIAERSRKRDHMKTANAPYRKGDAAALAALGLDLERLRAQVAAVGYSWVKAPFEAYQLTNLGATIRTDEKRIEEIKRRQALTARVEATPAGVLIEQAGEYCRVSFAEKPDREILNALREAGFYWGAGRWSGRADKLPAEVQALAEVTA